MNPEITMLSNGLRVVSVAMPAVHSVSVGVYVDVGSRFEAPEQNGISHFLEHMAFKGTQTRSQCAIAEAFDAIGGHVNAYTGRERTVYYAKVLKGDLSLAVDILADILQHSVFDVEELLREKGVILQEIAQTNDTPDDIVFDYYQAVAYPDQPVGRSILGTADLVNSFDAEHLRHYVGEYYTADRMVLAAAGAVDHAELVALAERYLASVPEGREVTCVPAVYRGGVHCEVKDLEQVHLVLGFEGSSYFDDDFYTSQILGFILGGGMSSRLFQEVREKRGLAYGVSSFGTSYVDSGVFSVYAGTTPEYVGELLDVVADELGKAGSTITEAEMERARTQVRAGLLMSRESTQSRAEELGHQLMTYGKPLSEGEILAKVDAVDVKAVEQYMTTLLTRSMSFASVGPQSLTDSFERLHQRLLGA